jgi:hypothetical protein
MQQRAGPRERVGAGVQAGAELGGLAQRVEELLATATAVESSAPRGHGLHEVWIPPGSPAHLTRG